MNVVYPPPWPTPILPPPTSGIPCTFTLSGTGSATIVVWRRRTVTGPDPIPGPGQLAPRVSIASPPIPAPSRLYLVAQAGEVVALGGSGAPVAYSTFSEDLTGSVGGSLPWIWWQVAGGPSLPAGARIALTGGMQVGNVALVVGNDGTVTWTGATS